MKFNEVMHLSFYTDQMDKMRDFYENKLGLKAKILWGLSWTKKPWCLG